MAKVWFYGTLSDGNETTRFKTAASEKSQSKEKSFAFSLGEVEGIETTLSTDLKLRSQPRTRGARWIELAGWTCQV